MPPSTHRSITIWLTLVCVVILALVAVGGVTRLTESGLSMVDWKPLVGIAPPMTERAWQEKFDQYRQYPEYQILKPHMELAEFKTIFFWEYLHRLLARASGLVFLLPYLYFLARRRLDRALALKLGVAFLLGGMQGLLGWYMVKSGLVQNPHVSHYRLAAHLSLAFLLFVYLLWIILGLIPRPAGTGPPPRRGLRQWSFVIILLLAVQIVYGAFVAGLDAGYMFNTFPMMMGRWIPPGLLLLEPALKNFVANATTVQFMHRVLGGVVVLAVLVYWYLAQGGDLDRRQKLAVNILFVLSAAQVVVGILTLILVVPVALATVHQVLACLLLGAGVFVLHAMGDSAAESS